MSDWDFADRLIPARSDLAAERLRGRVPAERYAAGERTSVAVALLDLRLDPDPGASLATQLLMGEPFEVYERRPDNLCWGQSLRDGYVGFVSADGLGPAGPAGVSVTALASHIYAEPDARAASLGALHFGAEVAVTDGSVAGFRKLRDGGYIPAMHLEPPAGSVADCALRFAGAPYLWGGRSVRGIDCSALVQLGCWGAGLDAPRDSDMQAAGLGRELGDDEALQEDDLVFWKGHVAIMIDATRIVHANAHHMAVAVEPLDQAVLRIARSGGGPVTTRRRLLGDRRNRAERHQRVSLREIKVDDASGP